MNVAFQTFGHGTSRLSSGTTNFIVDNWVKSSVERQERGSNFVCFFSAASASKRRGGKY